ncbi:UDP-N-acetylmuramoyl-L-alanine--D-glutamate ligase [Thermophilibacter provencensis]|uniref:UDP-N-acetylmuramoylalanine--D-glutamate ligase n=1 Tax=Thermophilibacter provencensis TaxID=1852386 RepID=A0ABT7V452_9ACTN|nr:UDP-N-acetylmuramoyl-L-alanine--D-glutamate ligase [Thermophilibacter provencensis]MDM8271375.1 UDP-N-acetylmuramoyl-L-alanine--D-glutamate ligase [Thermophilibacter provencensis]
MTTASSAHLGNVLVLGLGRTGESVARHLAALLGTRVDSVTLYGGASSAPGEKTRELEEAGVRVVCGTEDVRGSYDLAVASPGIPESSAFFRAAAARSSEIIGEPEFAFRESPERWVVITGTNGKTTTTSLTTHLLREGGFAAESVGNIGTLVTDEVASRPEGGWFVAELSSFQLATTRLLHPRVSVILNVTPDHLEWHGTMEAYAAAKERALENLGQGDLAVVSVDDEYCRAMAERAEGRGLRVCRLSVHGEPEGPCAAFLRGGELVVRLDGAETALLPASELKIFGLHNAENALAASAVALELGTAAPDVSRGLSSFSPIEHRIEPAGEVGGVRFVNDSKATNTDSVEKALTAFDAGTIVVLLGGHDKMTDLSSLAEAVCERCRVAVCFGEAGERIARALESARGERDLEVLRAEHLRDAFGVAVRAARPGDTVLLSPACSSFDEFNNMGERGRLFKALVRELADGEV